MRTSVYPEARKPDTPGLHRWVPRLIIAAATVHMMVGVGAAGSHWRGIVSDGLWNTVGNDDDARMMTLWFMISGMAFLGLGLLTRRTVIVTNTVPTETGWILLALGIPVSLMEPISGGWSLIAIGALALVASRHDGSATDSDQAATHADGTGTVG
ncbi:DUF6463 family protein [Streptomyces sp. R11]|uniref:DUF6463 family protein n=1 Tax=Streptomyces sp. R11 TaxID=3238625 RepID=A0AB39NAA8_9ACTN